MIKGGILTEAALKEMGAREVFARGEVVNSPEGVYMTVEHIGRKLKWIAQRGGMWDWTIYIGWADRSWDEILSNGDKVINPDNIKKMVPADEWAMKLYRY